MFSSLSGDRSRQEDSAVQHFQGLPQVKRSEHGDQILYFPKPVVLKLAFTYWWLINKVTCREHGSLEIAKGPVVFGALLTNPGGMFIRFADDIELEGLQSTLNSGWP